jgi:2-amino-4-hydroxy-6-hydroxymethyldihydropteridine diphosphokinase
MPGNARRPGNSRLFSLFVPHAITQAKPIVQSGSPPVCIPSSGDLPAYARRSVRYNWAMAAPHNVYLGLGTNLGDRPGNLRLALEKLRACATVEKVSSCYETRPVGYEDQPDFLNLTCFVTTALSPLQLLRSLKDIEQQMGRQAGFRNAPRLIDIDILLFDDLVVDSPELAIPHPRMNNRAFVLAPLADIAPEIVHPILKLTVREMLEKVDKRGITSYELRIAN